MTTPTVTNAIGQNHRALIDLLKAVRGTEVSVDWTPGDVAHGSVVSTEVTVEGAKMGDFVICSIDVDTDDTILDAHVTAADTVTVVMFNNSLSTRTFGEVSLRVRVYPRDVEVSGANTKNQQILLDTMRALTGTVFRMNRELPNVADRSQFEFTATVPGARMGMFVFVSLEIDVEDLVIIAEVQTDDTIGLTVMNNTGSVVNLDAAPMNIRLFSMPNDEQMGSHAGLNHQELFDMVQALSGIKTTYDWDIPAMVAGGEVETTVSVPGAKMGDFVLVTPTMDFASASTVWGSVGVSDGNVKLNAVTNHSAGVNPDPNQFEIRVLPQGS